MDAALVFAQDSTPLSIIAAAKIAGISLTIDPSLASGSAPTLYLGSVDFIHGINTILHYIARVAIVPNFYGQDAIQAAHVDQWLEYALVILSRSEFEAACSFLDGYLASRTFLVGYSLSIADIVVWSNIAGTGQRWESLRRSTKYQNLIRWFNCIAADYAGTLDEVVAAYVRKSGIGKSPAPSLKEKFYDPWLGEKDDLANHLNPCTRRETSALGDPDMWNLKQGEIIQLERKGYYRRDVPFTGPSKPFVIPDGRQQSPAN